MIPEFSSSEQSSLLPQNGRESQWCQASSGIWVPRTPLQSSPPQDEPVIEEAHPDWPVATDREGWQRYWAEQGWPWRREPEIPQTRQKELMRRRAIPVDMRQGLSPFEGITLTRADIEWLLATHDAGQGPIDWDDASGRARKGLDLRGAVVEDATDLGLLPLARLRGGLLPEESLGSTEEQGAHALLCLKRALLRGTHLEGASLRGAHLEGADLRRAHLEEASLRGAHLEGADLRGAHLEGASLKGTHLKGASLRGAHLEGAYLRKAYLEEVDLSWTHLEGASLSEAHLEGANLRGAHLEGADLRGAYLEGADLSEAHLERALLHSARLKGTLLSLAHLEGADLSGAHLEGANLRKAHLEEAYLGEASLTSVNLTGATLANETLVGPSLIDVKWGETNLSVVDWSGIQTLGDEYHARRSADADEQWLTWMKRRKAFQDAQRANHQLAVALQNQGLIDDAARFAYRAKCLKRTVFWYDLLLAQTTRQRFQISWPLLFSWALFLLAGYGYRLRRCLFWYVGIVLAFMLLYWWLDPAQLPWWAALGKSVNVFNGRGAAPAIADFSHPVLFTLLTVVEAIIGLVIEIVFVATVVQRLFGK
jgi:uncharacterized protein YjbI with pentapeptide repeats